VEFLNSGCLFVAESNMVESGRSKHLFLDCFSLLWKKDSVNVGKDTSRGNGDSSEKLVQLFIVLDGEGNVTRHNTALLVITGGVSGQLKNLGAEVFKDCSKVDGGTGSHSGGILALTQVTSDTTDWELKTSLGRSGGGLLLSTASLSFSFSSHDCVWSVFNY